MSFEYSRILFGGENSGQSSLATAIARKNKYVFAFLIVSVVLVSIIIMVNIVRFTHPQQYDNNGNNGNNNNQYANFNNGILNGSQNYNCACNNNNNNNNDGHTHHSLSKNTVPVRNKQNKDANLMSGQKTQTGNNTNKNTSTRISKNDAKIEFFNSHLLQIENKKFRQYSDKYLIQFLNGICAKKANMKPIYFIQIGAANGNIGETNDPLQKIVYASKYWHGMMIEPIAANFQVLTKNVQQKVVGNKSRIQLMNVALMTAAAVDNTAAAVMTAVTTTTTNGSSAKLPDSDSDSDSSAGSSSSYAYIYEIDGNKFQGVDGGKKGMWKRINSFSKQHILKHLIKFKHMNAQEAEKYVIKTKVKTMDAKQLLNAFSEHFFGHDGHEINVDVLVIDTEGYDLQALKHFFGDDSDSDDNDNGNGMNCNRVQSRSVSDSGDTVDSRLTFHPWLVIYEHLHLNYADRKSALRLMNHNGYQCFIQDVMNTVCLQLF